MNRWTRPLFASLALACAGAAFSQVVVQQAPQGTRLARLQVSLPPEIALDGRPDRLSPGARIRDTRNLQVLSGSLSGQNLPVVYRRDGAGLVHEVWLLTEAEYSRLGGGSSVGGTGNVTTGNAIAVAQFNAALAEIFGARR